MHDEGLSAAQIARVLGISRVAVGHHLHEEGRSGKQYGYVKEITPWQEAVLIGTMMGDARLCRGADHHNAQLKLGHSTKQLAYMLWKKEQLSSFFMDEVEPYVRTTKEGYETCEIRSRSHPILTSYLELFYPEGEKRVSRPLLQRIEDHDHFAVIMALWYMDDGHLAQDSASIVVGNMDDSQYEMLFTWFDDQGWKGTPRKQRSNCWTYFITSSASLRFAEVIAPYIHPSMLYKLPSAKQRRKIE
jgi:recombination protein RecA